MHPIFRRISPRLEGARRELQALQAADDALPADPSSKAAQWMRRSATAFAVTSVYTGLESILRVIADDIDRHLPSGADWHAELLLAMSLDLPGTRPPVISQETKTLLDDLRKFRHAARNNYALDLNDAGVAVNLQRLQRLLPLFERDLASFEATMTAEQPGDG